MLKNRWIVAVAAVAPLLMVVGMASAQPSYTKGKSYGFIQNAENPHNFSLQGWAGNEICKPCHTPHNALPTEISKRLWAHEVTTAVYKMHEGADEGAAEALDRVSRLCMSCHDGTLAPGDYKYSPSRTGGSITSGALIAADKDLSRQHPVGKDGVYPDASYFKKPVVGTDSYGNPSVSVQTSVSLGGTATATVKLPLQHMYKVDATTGTVTLDKWAVGCSTCHHPHGTRPGDTSVYAPGSAPLTHLLRMENAGSAMCLACHNK